MRFDNREEQLTHGILKSEEILSECDTPEKAEAVILVLRYVSGLADSDISATLKVLQVALRAHRDGLIALSHEQTDVAAAMSKIRDAAMIHVP